VSTVFSILFFVMFISSLIHKEVASATAPDTCTIRISTHVDVNQTEVIDFVPP